MAPRQTRPGLRAWWGQHQGTAGWCCEHNGDGAGEHNSDGDSAGDGDGDGDGAGAGAGGGADNERLTTSD
eukprot:9977227-Lingulodinium_polyedra.AAC.1